MSSTGTVQFVSLTEFNDAVANDEIEETTLYVSEGGEVLGVSGETLQGALPSLLPGTNKIPPMIETIRRMYRDPGAVRTPDPTKFEEFLAVATTLNYIYFYRADRASGYPDIFGSTLAYYFYNYYTVRTPGVSFPEMPVGAGVKYLVFDYSIGDSPDVLPASWANMKYLQRIYLRRNGYTTAQVDSLISQIDTLCANGMGSLYSSTKNIYLNLTGVDENATPTLATHTANGWTVGTTSMTRVYFGRTIRIYFNP